ncbi:serine/threonine protein kinase [Rubripirellula amarantea]|nr:serine/threonine protein kinase [Rubripirellula amarantea]
MAPFETLGPYRIGELIGRGGMGNVYAAKHMKTGETVAVKVIASHVADEPKFRRRFDKEVRALRMLRHPGIVRLVGVGEESGKLFYSMELISGETLQARIRREKKLDWRSVIDIAIQICAALKHAHDIGVTHRDLKPANLLVTPDGAVKLVDFGIPNLFGDMTDQTAPGSVLGTPDYMAPEQARGEGVTLRTDLYALGSVMYSMLTGRPPFKGKNANQVVQKLLNERPIPLDMLETDMPESLVELVDQLLEKVPSDRPPSALVVMNRLKSMRAGLMREQTLVDDGPETANGTTNISSVPQDLHERDTSESGSGGFGNSDSTAISQPSVSPSGKTVAKAKTVVSRGRRSSGHADDTGLVSGIANRESGSNPSRKAVQDVTVASAMGNTSDDHTSDSISGIENAAYGNASRSNTHFETVSDDATDTGFFREHTSHRPSHIVGVLTVIAMASVLIGGGYLFYVASMPPSADQVYEQLDNDFDASLAQTFMRRFPGDSRFDDVQERWMESRVLATLKRLRAKSKLGLTPMDPAEESFLLALEDRQTEPAESAKKLAAWLNVFDSDKDEVDSELLELVELARHQQAHLAIQTPVSKVDDRAAELIRDMDQWENQADRETIVRKLNGVIVTFGQQEWASPAVQEAKERLQELQSAAKP